MHRLVAITIKICDLCQKNKKNYAASGKTTSHKPTKKLETVSIVMIGPLPTGRGGTHYILAILDTFIKFIKLYALKRAITSAILNRIIKDYIPTAGKPESILSDNGTQSHPKHGHAT